MKLDLIAIEKLSPAGLYPLADLRAFVSVLVKLIRLGIGNVRDRRSYAHMLLQHRKILRERMQHNQNLKTKAWIKQCHTRTDWVRSVIGEAAIRSWIARLRAAYTSTKFMGDGFWADAQDKKTGFKHGLKHHPRTRKPFALVRLSEVEKLLPFRPRWPRRVHRIVSDDTGNVRHAARSSRQDRSQRPQKTVRFFPSEIGVKIREPETKNHRDTKKYIEDPSAKVPENPPRKPNGSPQADNPQPEKPP